MSTSGQWAGIGFAIPVDAIRRVVPELIRLGRYAHPWLGVELRRISASYAQELGVDRGVQVVLTVVPGDERADVQVRLGAIPS